MRVNNLSIKSKTIILVLSIVSILSIIFFFIRYHDIKEFVQINQLQELKKVKLAYEQTLQRTKKFYITRGYANINSYGIREAFINNDVKSLHQLSKPRWKIISKENRFLEQFCFYDKKGKLITYFGQKPSSKLSFKNKFQTSYDGFWQDNGKFYYHTVSIVKDKKNHNIGFVVFVINPKYFLQEIEKLIDIDAYIIYKTDQILPNIDINRYKQYFLKVDGINSNNNFKILFLQDMYNWKSILKKAVIQGIILLILIAIITIIIVNYGFEIILKELEISNKKLKTSQNELEKLNENLQHKVNKEVQLKLIKQQEINEKQKILIHQNKLASMGEMIGNIAHQWRQPLTELSLVFITLELYFQKRKLDRAKLNKIINEANNQISFMSNTIDDFRNFFVSGKKKQIYKVSEVIEIASHLLSASLKNNNIKLQIDIIEDFNLNGYPNELSQAILNIISNAKDIFLEQKIKNAKITINTFCKDSKCYINISDNAGGVKISPINKIFEPYFSTKHAKSGTGIGLYMSKIIIEKNNNGKLSVENTNLGALFKISFSTKNK